MPILADSKRGTWATLYQSEPVVNPMGQKGQHIV
jgi:hypothetical protein